ncbi:16S rRNA (cytosine(967)-C(5))-methyltransferase RsmB [Paenibacillus sp. DXFW5]|jgi:16S rRNA (cytosine967-C5)-methyltransferase|uniref:16S rRNA (cytosine(967)-C(5))-methyltransferase n=2 Tax=Paenibacillus TaxID=44249 RepID=A0ABS2HA29_9BACL|nr:16S rRNA (cytosine(967)-C(5))-methyltransferase RsmB [Paenibacillus rhizolycopersici]GIP48037.1 ribosomal RNA small subunit methyltransferase B [Paenibacillus sp. J53TS2]
MSRANHGSGLGTGTGTGSSGKGPGQGRGAMRPAGGDGRKPAKPTGTSSSQGMGRGLIAPSARSVALQVLTAVEQEGAYSNLLLNGALQKSGLTGPDAGLATELVYGTIQRLNTIDYFLEPFVTKGLAKLAPWVRNLLRLSFYQLHYLDRIPPHAAVNEAVNLAKKKGHQGISGMVNGVLRSVLRRKEELRFPEGMDPVQRIALEHSHPEWMVKLWIRQYGEEAAEAICRANNEPPSVSVRVNRARISRNEMIRLMEEQGLQAAASKISPDGIVVHSGGNMALTSWYREGLISVQDESSMLVAEALDPRPGMTVLDCCAAPGGKTCHIAEIMEGRGRVLANDIHPHKAKLIEDQAKRLDLENIDTLSSDAMQLAERLDASSFDRILLDAPCSGLGVIRRKPDLKWAKTPGDVAEIAGVQRALLDSASGLLKPGGLLVYSTCTIEPRENAEMVASFLNRHPEFELAVDEPAGWSGRQPLEAAAGRVEAGLQILPQDAHSDGFYIARLRKKSEGNG